MLLLTLLASLAAIPFTGVAGQDLVATLDYGTFEGAYSSTYNISYWKKIPFAAPPVGQNRFRAPQPPLPITNGTYNSDQDFDMCPQRTVNGSEDCLYLGLYSRPWTAGQPLRPVVVTFYGGAFIEGSASFTLPPPAYPILNVSESSDMIFVYPNYRLNSFGFLPGRQIAADPLSDLNPGLRDQEKAIEWASAYIAQFGGDPDRISIWGQSAGGGSVVAQSIARKHDPPLFKQALLSSPFWPKTYRYDDDEAQLRYDTLVNLTGCADSLSSGNGSSNSSSSNDTSLACLKSLSVDVLRNASLVMSTTYIYGPTSYPWCPVIDDGDFLPSSLAAVTSTPGVETPILAFGMYNAHEGENFIPPGFKTANSSATLPQFNSSSASFDVWLAGFLPWFTEQDLDRLRTLYPAAGSTESIVSYNDTYTRAGLVYRDSVLACPSYWTAGAAPEGQWLGEYTIPPAQHASDVYWWNTVNSAQQTDPLHYEGYTGAFASFFMTGDPNALKLTPANVTGVPALATGDEFVITTAGFNTTKLTQFRERCDFWREWAPKVPI